MASKSVFEAAREGNVGQRAELSAVDAARHQEVAALHADALERGHHHGVAAGVVAAGPPAARRCRTRLRTRSLGTARPCGRRTCALVTATLSESSNRASLRGGFRVLKERRLVDVGDGQLERHRRRPGCGRRLRRAVRWPSWSGLNEPGSHRAAHRCASASALPAATMAASTWPGSQRAHGVAIVIAFSTTTNGRGPVIQCRPSCQVKLTPDTGRPRRKRTRRACWQRRPRRRGREGPSRSAG